MCIRDSRENNEWPKGSPERTYYTLEDEIQNICLTYDLKCTERCKADTDWPRTTYAIYAAFITEPYLFSEAEDDEDDEPAAKEKLRRLKNKIGRSGYPELRLNAALTDDQIKRLFEYAGTETGPLMLEAFRENMAGGLTRANKIKWFWCVNVLSFVIFHESQKEREAAEAAATVPPGPATAPDNASPSPAKRTKNDPPPPPALQQPSTPRLPAWGGRGASRGGLLVGLSRVTASVVRRYEVGGGGRCSAGPGNRSGIGGPRDYRTALDALGRGPAPRRGPGLHPSRLSGQGTGRRRPPGSR